MKIYHIMKDGSQAENLSGHIVKIDETDVYRAIKEGEKNELQDPTWQGSRGMAEATEQTDRRV